MIEFLFNLIINPLCLIFEFIFDNIFDLSKNILFSIFSLSFIVSILCLPMYLKAEKLQKEEKELQKKLSKKVNIIKKNFKGDERFFLLQTYYRQNNYNPLMSFRAILGLLLQIPVFLAAYIFFSHLEILNNMPCFIISDLSKADMLLRIGNIHINLLPILMTIVNLLAGFIYSKRKDKKEKNFLIITSFVFLVLLYNSPSGLVLYWAFNNLFSLIKNIFFGSIKIKKIEIKDFIPDFDYKTNFLLILFSLWLIFGIYIPSNILSASPYEFIFDDSNPLGILKYSAQVYLGLFLVWGCIIYYFLNLFSKKIYVLILNLFLFSSIFHLIMYKMPTATLTNTFAFSAYKIDFINYNKIYLAISLIALIMLLFFVIKLIFSKKIKLLNLMIVSFIIASLSISSVQIYKISSKLKAFLINKKEEKILKDKYITLSKNKKNVLIIFADRAIASYIPIIFSEKPDLYEKYKGFTYYPNTLSYAQYTLLGYPAILGGYEYNPFKMNFKKGLYEEKFAQAITMLPAIFSLNHWDTKIINPINEGWESETWGGVTNRQIDILAQSNLYDKFKIKHETISDEISQEFQKEIKITNSSLAKRNIIFYSMLSTIPLNLRKWFYDDGLYHNPNNNTRNSYSKEFLKAYAELYNISNLTDFSSKKNTFNVFNSSLTHNPSFLRYPNYNLSLYDDLTYYCPMENKINLWSLRHYHTNMALIKLLGDYFDFLKKNGVYDNTRIIIVSDHGIGYGLQNPYLTNFEMENFMPYNALLMVKDFNQNGNIKINFDFMTNADTPSIALKNIIKFPKNPFSGEILSSKEKNNGIIIKADTLWQPVYYLGKEKILNNKNKFHYVKNNPYEEKNWKMNLEYKQALKMLEI